MTEYVKIYLCGDCAYYDWKKHKCKRGAKVDDGSSFFRDCPIGIHEEKDGERVDTVPVRHGRWKEDPSGYGFWICSACGFVSEASAADMLYNFCPACGAKMDGKDGDGNG